MASAADQTPEDFYELRHTLKPGQVFHDYDGDLLKLDRRVPGDTKWYAAIWSNGSWSYDDYCVEPGDLVSRANDPVSL